MPNYTWMIRSDIFVQASSMSTTFIIHCWNDGRVVIYDLNRPVRIDVPDDDIRLLSEWCRVHGWKNLEVHDRLLTDKSGFDCWQRFFRAGLVFSKELEQYEDEETKRLTEAYEKELEEESCDN